MEVELERKIAELELSVKDIDERLAEIYREMAGLSLQKSSVVRKVKADTAVSRKCADDVRRMHSELKSGLKEVSDRMAGTDALISKLNYLRRSANAGKSGEVAELGTSLIRMNRKVSELNRALEGLRLSQGRPHEDLAREIASVRSSFSRLERSKDIAELRGSVARLDARLLELGRKTGDTKLKKEMMGVKSSVAGIERSLGRAVTDERLKREMDGMRSSFARLEKALDGTVTDEKLDRVVSGVSGSVRLDVEARLKGLPVVEPSKMKELEKRHAELERRIGGVDSSKEELKKRIDNIDFSRVDLFDKKLEEVRNRANSLLDGLYDRMDGMEKKFASMPRVTVDGTKADITGLVAEVGELRSYVETLVKGLEISRAIAEELKSTQGCLSAVEDWKNRTEDLPHEVAKLAERLSAVEAEKAAVKGDAERVDMNNLKAAVAELSNKARLINELALENQKLLNRIFVLEKTLERKGKKA